MWSLISRVGILKRLPIQFLLTLLPLIAIKLEIIDALQLSIGALNRNVRAHAINIARQLLPRLPYLLHDFYACTSDIVDVISGRNDVQYGNKLDPGSCGRATGFGGYYPCAATANLAFNIVQMPPDRFRRHGCSPPPSGHIVVTNITLAVDLGLTAADPGVSVVLDGPSKPSVRLGPVLGHLALGLSSMAAFAKLFANLAHNSAEGHIYWIALAVTGRI